MTTTRTPQSIIAELTRLACAMHAENFTPPTPKPANEYDIFADLIAAREPYYSDSVNDEMTESLDYITFFTSIFKSEYFELDSRNPKYTLDLTAADIFIDMITHHQLLTADLAEMLDISYDISLMNDCACDSIRYLLPADSELQYLLTECPNDYDHINS